MKKSLLVQGLWKISSVPKKFSVKKVAARVLKNGGSLICMTGQSYLPDVIRLLSTEMRYHWCLSYLTPGGQSSQLFQRRVNTFWKPVLWFVKGDYSGDWTGDVLKSSVNDNDKRFHEWGQSISGMKDIIERLTNPDDTILDPFLGGGTTGFVSVTRGRKFIGVDIDFLMLEYDCGKASALVEYKNEFAAPQHKSHPSYQALIDLGNRAEIPVFACRYSTDFTNWRVTPLNRKAQEFCPTQRDLTEQEWVALLYKTRGRRS